MIESFDAAVIGGGPAGTAAAITAARHGRRVLLLERGGYPRHKVCGEFVSAEALDRLGRLLAGTPGQDLLARAPRIRRTRLFLHGQSLNAAIQPEAASISRYELDAALWGAAQAAGVECRLPSVARDVVHAHDGFHISTDAGAAQARAVIIAAGRWSNLLPAPVARDKNWVGIKAHFNAHAGDSVDLYFSADGYCGVQPVGPGQVNVCAMVTAAAVRPADLMGGVLGLHPSLQAQAACWRQATETVTTAPLFFASPVPVRDAMLCVGDAAGFIDPFLGDGISLAVQSGILAAECLDDAAAYAREYCRRFVPLFRRAARLRWLLRAPGALRRVGVLLLKWPAFGRTLVRTTRA